VAHASGQFPHFHGISIMSITVSAGEDPATVSIRQNAQDGTYDYIETIYDVKRLARVIGELGYQLSRMMEYQHSQELARRRRKANE
jgi:hypothetical protein